MPDSHPFVRKSFALNPLAACLAVVLAGGGLAPTDHAAATPATAATTDQGVRSSWLAGARRNARPGHVHTRSHAASLVRPAATLPVTSCADDGSEGTLRSVIAKAESGDTIDLGDLECSTITLEQGAIAIAIDDLAVQGPQPPLTIDGGGVTGLFEHYGAGVLAIDHLTLANGTYPGGGACVFSAASVVITNSTVSNCHADESAGGGVLALGDLTLESSTLSGNSAIAGGAATADGQLVVRNSTISGNTAEAVGGGLYMGGSAADGAGTTLENSTITLNEASFAGGGIYFAYEAPITMRSSIIAGNSGPTEYAADVGGGYILTIVGNNNLIASSDLIVPADTLGDDPQLLPLADNGGPTQTHALADDSPAIDAGNNIAGLAFDQRGEGFARVVGKAADIGAFELQEGEDDDTIFKDGFDG